MQAFPSAPVPRPQRVSATIPIGLLLPGKDIDTEHDAYTVDISPECARIRTAFVLFAGQMVGIIPTGDSGSAIPWRVVWVERSSSGPPAGFELLETGRAKIPLAPLRNIHTKAFRYSG
jgi:hypothetical protein